MLKKIFASWWATFNEHPHLMVGAFFAGVALCCVILLITGDIP